MDANNKDKGCHHHSPGIYQPRHPENTVLYQILQEDLETWITQTQENGGYVSPHVEKDFRAYLKCGLLCYGFARARCTCGNEFLVAFSCKGHGICPSCNARRMVETAAHQVDHVFPKVPVRQWVLSLPKRLRYFLYHNPKITSKASASCSRPLPASMQAMLLARIYNLFPLLCPECGAEMNIIAVIQDKTVIKKIVNSVGEMNEPSILSPARGPPSWDDCNQDLPDDNDQSISEYEFNQCVS